MIEIFLSALGVLLISGILVKELGGADSVQEGMTKVCKKISDICKEGNLSPENVVRSIDDQTLSGLTRKLEPFFEILILENACENCDILSVVYRQRGCNATLDMIELIFKNFLKNYFNLPANAPVHVIAAIDEERLYLNCAYSEKGRQVIQQQRNNRRSREIGSVDDLIE